MFMTINHIIIKLKELEIEAWIFAYLYRVKDIIWNLFNLVLLARYILFLYSFRFLIYLNLWRLLHHREIKHDFVTIIVDREILLPSFVRAKKLFLLNFWISTSTEVVGREVFAHPSCQGWHDISRILIHQKFTKCWLTTHSSAGSLT